MAPKNSNKINLKERLEEGELDLSMSDLQEVPVKEIVALKKVISLDLSNNRLSVLGKHFITMTSVVKLELSQNQLMELPEDFGEMKQLKYLDLYCNQLKHLPLSFYQLKNLRWLDLKSNPLVPAVAKVAGPCIDSSQCVQCAKDVVKFFTQMKEQVEIEKARREELYQADLEAEAVHQKQQQKKKEKKKALKAKKNKVKVEKVTEEIIPIVEISPQHNVIKNNHPKSKPKIHAKPQKSAAIFIKSAMLFFVLAGSLIFVLSSAKVQPAVLFKEKTVSMWGGLQNLLPPTWRPWIIQIENHITNVHAVTGKLVENAINTTNHFARSEYVSSSVQIIGDITTVITNETKKMYLLLSDQVLFLSTEIKKKFT